MALLPATRWYLLVPILICLAACHTVSLAADDSASEYSRAESLIREHQWDEGLAVLRTLLSQNPDNPRLLNLAGLALTGKGDRAKADESFTAALKVKPDFVPARKNLAINEFELKDFKAAQRNLELAAKQAPDDPVVNMYLGEIFFGTQDYQHAAAALAHAQALLSRDPDLGAQLVVSYLKTGSKQSALDSLAGLRSEGLTPHFQFLLGVALADSDLPAQAIPYLEAVERAHPESPDIGYDLVLCYLAAKQYAQAIATARSLIDQGHDTADVENVLAEAYEDSKNTQAAVDALRRAIALNPEEDDNYLDFASLCMNHQAYGEAAQVLEVGLRVHPKSSRLIFERGILNAMQDHYDLAEKDFEASSALAPDTDSGYIGLGVTYIETGNAAQAIPVLRKRLRDKPDDASLLYLLGEALVRSGAGPGDAAFAEAQSSLEKSVRLNSGLCLPHVALGKVYLAEGRAQEAANQFELARLIDPKEKSAYSHLAVAYRRLGQPEKAKEILSFLRDINDQQRASPGEKMKPAATPASN